MTATWALVYMLCSSRCEPQYVITYNLRSECVRNIPKREGMIVTEKFVCVPITKD